MAAEAFRTSIELRPEGDGRTWFYLAIAEWKQGNHDDANTAYDRGVGWLDLHKPEPKKWPEAMHLHARRESAGLLGK